MCCGESEANNAGGSCRISSLRRMAHEAKSPKGWGVGEDDERERERGRCIIEMGERGREEKGRERRKRDKGERYLCYSYAKNGQRTTAEREEEEKKRKKRRPKKRPPSPLRLFQKVKAN
jgi:hypothetical protein